MSDSKSQRCERCGSKIVIDAPPFAEMSDQNKRDWKASGGQIMLLCDCGARPV